MGDGEPQYLVKWSGCDGSENTWHAESDFELVGDWARAVEQWKAAGE